MDLNALGIQYEHLDYRLLYQAMPGKSPQSLDQSFLAYDQLPKQHEKYHFFALKNGISFKMVSEKLTDLALSTIESKASITVLPVT